jgi:long-chain acyl-CoA synthetase
MTGARWTPAAAVAALEAGGDRPALMVAASGAVEQITAGTLARQVYGAAEALAAVGVRRGDAVAVHGANGPAWIATGLACGWLGAALAPLDALTEPGEAARIAAAVGARALVTDIDPGSKPGAGPVVTLPFDALGAADRAAAPDPAPLAPDDPAAVFRTSGTTGAPKTFRLTLGNVAAVADAIAGCGLLRPDDRVLMPLPLHHVYPWITATLPTLRLGAVLILPESAAGPHVADALRAGRPTVIVGVPKLYDAFLAGLRGRARSIGRLAGAAFDGLLRLAIAAQRAGLPLGPALFAPLRRAAAPDLRMLVCGGARLEPATTESLEAIGWDVRTGYGLSETASMVAGNLVEKRLGSEGRAMAGAEIRILKPDAAGVGEIAVRGPGVFSSYIDNPEETARAFVDGGFFRTGDLGRLDADGFLHVVGRAKEVIVLGGGENLFPEDVEKRYEAAADIAEIGVFERDGQLLALIRPEMASIAARGVLRPENAVKVALSGVAPDLPSTWRLSGFALTRTPLPRTRLGKLRRFKLPRLYDRAKAGGAAEGARALTAEDRAWVEAPPRKAVWTILTRDRANGAVDLDSHLQLDLGFDSFGWMSLALAIEQETGLRLDPRRVGGIATVRDLLEAVSEAAAAPGGPIAAARADAERARWLAPRSALQRMAGRALLALNAALMRLLFRLEVSGAEGLPPDGPLLICPNHASDLDPSAIGAALPPALRPRLRWAADRVRVFSTRASRAFCRALRVFPVDETDPLAAVGMAAEALGRGEVQVWFPEGWRSADGRLLPFQSGVGLLLQRAETPVIPVFIDGTRAAWPRSRRLPRPGRVRVTFGAPMTLADLVGADGSDADPAAIAEALRRAVGALGRARGADIL